MKQLFLRFQQIGMLAKSGSMMVIHLIILGFQIVFGISFLKFCWNHLVR